MTLTLNKKLLEETADQISSHPSHFTPKYWGVFHHMPHDPDKWILQPPTKRSPFGLVCWLLHTHLLMEDRQSIPDVSDNLAWPANLEEILPPIVGNFAGPYESEYKVLFASRWPLDWKDPSCRPVSFEFWTDAKFTPKAKHVSRLLERIVQHGAITQERLTPPHVTTSGEKDT